MTSNKIPKKDCLYCGAKKHWQLYIDTITGEILPAYYGRCDNEVKCKAWNDPYKDGYAKKIREQENFNYDKKKYFFRPTPATPATPKPKVNTVFFDFETFKQTLEIGRYEQNTFIQNLFHNVQFPFNVKDVTSAIELYRLGTIAKGYMAGATTFPFIDIENNVRTIQVKQFDEHNHTTGTDYLHSIIEKYYSQNNNSAPQWLTDYNKQDKYVSCLFGEHLLNKFPNNPVALVEAPKTAIYGALYFGFPDNIGNFIWLAVYNKSSFSFDKLKVLKGRDVYVFPDLSKDGNTYTEWQRKAKEYESLLPGTRFIFYDLLEQIAPEMDKNKGLDIADYLIRFDWRLFRKQNIPPAEDENAEALAAFDKWFGLNPDGGIFSYGSQKFSITKKQSLNNGMERTTITSA
ncbi:DUF6371 domain-containing protein [Parafilimonas sp.]|uniref:DUF6371 domain-containing protein n=1 Tax=Parafilimonas sp. TaxID=1969739 RepID=UPI0039E5F78A